MSEKRVIRAMNLYLYRITLCTYKIELHKLAVFFLEYVITELNVTYVAIN